MPETCPICDSELNRKEDHLDFIDGMGPTLEQYDDCPNGCFSYEFVTGSYRQTYMIHGVRVSFYGSYRDDEDQEGLFNWQLSVGRITAQTTVQNLAREVFLEDLKSANEVLREYARENLLPSAVQQAA